MLLIFSSGFFPPQAVESLERNAESRGYVRLVRPAKLIEVLIKSFILRVPSLQAIGRVFSNTLGTSTKSTLSYALRQMIVLKVVKEMAHQLGERCCLDHNSIVVIDSMAVTLPRTQRSNAAKFNNHTVGMGVLWQYAVNATKGTNPVKILKTVHGSWNDSHQIRGYSLQPQGPIYVMDRGFWSLTTIGDWQQHKVRFVVRAKASQCCYQIVQSKGPARKVGKVVIVEDCIAVIGKNPKTQLQLRLVWCQANDKDLILVSSELKAPAEQILAIYKQRWAIERFHKVVKHVLGLAHLYSFQANGLELLVHIAFLLAALIYLMSKPSTVADDLIKLLRSTVRQIRAQLGITEWKPNICTHKWTKKKVSNH